MSQSAPNPVAPPHERTPVRTGQIAGAWVGAGSLVLMSAYLLANRDAARTWDGLGRLAGLTLLSAWVWSMIGAGVGWVAGVFVRKRDVAAAVIWTCLVICSLGFTAYAVYELREEDRSSHRLTQGAESRPKPGDAARAGSEEPKKPNDTEGMTLAERDRILAVARAHHEVTVVMERLEISVASRERGARTLIIHNPTDFRIPSLWIRVTRPADTNVVTRQVYSGRLENGLGPNERKEIRFPAEVPGLPALSSNRPLRSGDVVSVSGSSHVPGVVPPPSRTFTVP